MNKTLQVNMKFNSEPSCGLHILKLNCPLKFKLLTTHILYHGKEISEIDGIECLLAIFKVFLLNFFSIS
jgi:hypothetical protein